MRDSRLSHRSSLRESRPASSTATSAPTLALFFTSATLLTKLLPPVSSRIRLSKNGVHAFPCKQNTPHQSNCLHEN